jgi:hypothetical protein
MAGNVLHLLGFRIHLNVAVKMVLPIQIGKMAFGKRNNNSTG